MRPNCMHLTRVRPTLQIFTTARALSRLSFDLHGPTSCLSVHAQSSRGSVLGWLATQVA